MPSIYFFGARYYSPFMGRFITADPSGMIDGPNLYVYVGNNPVNLVDVWGLCGEKTRVVYLEVREYWKLRDLSFLFPGTFFYSEWQLRRVEAYYKDIPKSYELKKTETRIFYEYPFGLYDYKYENIWYDYGPPY